MHDPDTDGLPRPWFRRRWVMVVGVVILFGAIVVGGNAIQAGFFTANLPVAETEPGHRVNYQIVTVGTANGSLDISYTSASGTTETDTAPGHVQVWFKEVTTDPGQTHVTLQGTGTSTDLAFQMTCSILVDGRPAGTQTGPFGCTLLVDLRAARVSASGRPPVPPPTTSAASIAPTVTDRPAPPAACRYITTDEAARIVSAELGDGSYKPVLAIGGDKRRCTYTFDYEASRIRFSWIPGGKASGFPGTEISGLGTRAYWADYGMFATLEVQLPRGLFTVEPFFQTGPVDKRKISIELFRAARKRLPR
jgi:hypothetical protein